MRDRQRSTIVDIARAAGVSVSTVSRVINGKPDVSPRTKRVVLDTMLAQGFMVNPVARSLVGARMRVIGALARTLNSAFATGVLQGAMEVGEESGYGLLLLPAELDPANPSAGLLHAVADGVLVVSPGLATNPDPGAFGKPVVYVEQHRDAGNHGVTVTTTNREGTASLARYLIGLGHRRIAYVTGPEYLESSRERLHGYLAALDDHGIPRDDRYVVRGGFDVSSGVEAARSLMALRPAPTAIMASNDRSAFGVLQALAELGLRVPHDVSVVGFDDVPLAAASQPPLTTVHQPVYEMGRTAMETLVAWIERGEVAAGKRELPTRLVVRESSARPRIGSA
jgi:LacI family transcriptional regulator